MLGEGAVAHVFLSRLLGGLLTAESEVGHAHDVQRHGDLQPGQLQVVAGDDDARKMLAGRHPLAVQHHRHLRVAARRHDTGRYDQECVVRRRNPVVRALQRHGELQRAPPGVQDAQRLLFAVARVHGCLQARRVHTHFRQIHARAPEVHLQVGGVRIVAVQDQLAVEGLYLVGQEDQGDLGRAARGQRQSLRRYRELGPVGAQPLDLQGGGAGVGQGQRVLHRNAQKGAAEVHVRLAVVEQPQGVAVDRAQQLDAGCVLHLGIQDAIRRQHRQVAGTEFESRGHRRTVAAVALRGAEVQPFRHQGRRLAGLAEVALQGEGQGGAADGHQIHRQVVLGARAGREVQLARLHRQRLLHEGELRRALDGEFGGDRRLETQRVVAGDAQLHGVQARSQADAIEDHAHALRASRWDASRGRADAHEQAAGDPARQPCAALALDEVDARHGQRQPAHAAVTHREEGDGGGVPGSGAQRIAK